jgi:opacity protein-like surface antigen
LAAQNDLDSLENMLNAETGPTKELVSATFKATRILNGHSIERMPQGQLDVRFHHRFGPFNQGAYNFWGLDGANTFFSLEYGITDWVMVGVGRSSIEKAYNGFAKFSLFRQSAGSSSFPVSISWLSSIAVRTEKFPDIDSIKRNNNYPFSTRLSFVNELLIARKLNKNFSLQITPGLIHYNLVPTETDPNNLFYAGIGGRFKLTSRISLNAEYYYSFWPNKKYLSQEYKNAFAIGFDIETGGHVFQLIFTNGFGMIENQFIGRSTEKWNNAGIHFGFNISRVFDINHKVK